MFIKCSWYLDISSIHSICLIIVYLGLVLYEFDLLLLLLAESLLDMGRLGLGRVGHNLLKGLSVLIDD